MFLNVITLFIALSISAVAIYYSVAGLATIFAASVLPIIIMGTTLEVAKLVTAVWLHKHWRNAVWWLKAYLATAVIVLMFITSMGIFGFLSKSHIEQAAASDEQTAKIESITNKVSRAEIKIKRYQDEIARLSSGEADTRVDTLIEREQRELNRITGAVNAEKQTARDATQRTVDSLNANLAAARNAHTAEMPALLKAASSCFSCREEEAAVKDARDKFAETEARINKQVDEARANLKTELARIDDKYKLQFGDVNKRLAQLKEQSEAKTGNIDQRIAKLEKDIETEQAAVDSVREEKAVLESKFRQLEAEVGPVKYIAQFVYGPEAGRDLLEEAVRWVIITIIFVFDPLAVLLLIASQYSFEMARDNKKKNDSEPDPDPILPDPTPDPEPKKKKVSKPSPPLQSKAIEIPQIEDFPEREQPLDQEREPLDLEPAPVKKVVKKKATKKKKKVAKKKIVEPKQEEKPVAEKKVTKKRVTKKKEIKDEPSTAGTDKPNARPAKKAKKQAKPSSNERVAEEVKEETFLDDPNALRNDNPDTQLVRSGEYINYKGKLYKDDALIATFPSLELDYYLKHRVPFGPRFPEKMQEGRLFIRTDLLPTKLYRSNGKEWELQDKNILHRQSYSADYVQVLVDKVAEGEYYPELLNDIEKQLIKEQIADEF